MDNKGILKGAGLIAIVIALAGLTAFANPIEEWPTNSLLNGDFSEGPPSSPAHWDVGLLGDVSFYALGGKAIFLEEEDSVSSATLSQKFTIPDLAQVLSFEIQFLSGVYHETDVFTASLLDTNGVSLTGSPNFFHWDNSTSDPNFIGTIVLDISGLAGQKALLSFDLQFDGVGEPTTEVRLGGVIVPIPAPGALLLGLIGTGAVGFWRRFSR